MPSTSGTGMMAQRVGPTCAKHSCTFPSECPPARPSAAVRIPVSPTPQRGWEVVKISAATKPTHKYRWDTTYRGIHAVCAAVVHRAPNTDTRARTHVRLPPTTDRHPTTWGNTVN
eukprot:m.858776 g.858776  ORF g.858776 m.858776 type:complete len:115 (+) comp23524_c0_seq5:2127-2471(+)